MIPLKYSYLSFVTIDGKIKVLLPMLKQKKDGLLKAQCWSVQGNEYVH